MLRPSCTKCAGAAGWASALGNILVASVKWYVGILFNSQAVLADATHTTIDLAGSLVNLVTTKICRRQPTRKYPYGFGNLEYVTALAIYVILVSAGVVIAVRAILSIVSGQLGTPSLPAVFVTLISISANATMYFFIDCAGRQANRPALIALACENRADSISSIAALFGVTGAILGFPMLDPLAAICVAVVIVVGNTHRLLGTARKLSDTALPHGKRHAIMQAAAGVPHVLAVLAVKTRYVGTAGHADVDLLVDPDISVEAADALALAVSERIRATVSEVAVVRVYTHPSRDVVDPKMARLGELLTVMGELRTQQQR